MTPDLSPPASFSPLRRFGIGLNVVLSVAALLALVVMANYLAARHFQRFHWASHGRPELAPPTLRLLQALTNQVKVTVLFDRKDSLFGPVDQLLKEYAYACPRLTVEHVDYKRDVSRGELVITTYQLPREEGNLVIFEANHRSKVVRAAELSDYDWTGLLQGEREVYPIAFKGEALFTSAIASLLESRPPAAYFLQGHGEHDPASDERIEGYAEFARLLRQKNITVAPLRLPGENEIPEDCQLLIVAGPQHRLDPGEIEKINKYLNQGGRLLALLNHHRSHYRPTGLEKLFAGWGVTLGENFVFDRKNAISKNDLVCTNFAPHPISKPLRRSSIYLSLPRSVDPSPGRLSSGDAAKVEVIASTSTDGYAASQIKAGVPQDDPFRDRRGAIPLIVTVEKGSIQGVSADRGSTRIVVAGESLFLGNGILGNESNQDFASLAVNWLLDRPNYLAGITARPVREYRITLTTTELVHLRWILLVALPGAVLLVGALVWLRRRA